MAPRTNGHTVLTRRALRVSQTADFPLYLFSLTAAEILQIADISRITRDQAGELIGYQRPEVRQHIQEIVEYLNSDEVIFPNPIILALSSGVRFTQSRGPKVSDGFAATGTVEIPFPTARTPSRAGSSTASSGHWRWPRPPARTSQSRSMPSSPTPSRSNATSSCASTTPGHSPGAWSQNCCRR